MIDASIYKYFNSNFEGDVLNMRPISELLRKMANCGIDISIEPFCQGIFQTLKERGYRQLKKKSAILVDKAARLIGIVDEYGILEENEIFCKVTHNNQDFVDITEK